MKVGPLPGHVSRDQLETAVREVLDNNTRTFDVKSGRNILFKRSNAGRYLKRFFLHFENNCAEKHSIPEEYTPLF